MFRIIVKNLTITMTTTITIIVMISKLTKITNHGNNHNDGTIIIMMITIIKSMTGLDDFHVVAKGPNYWLYYVRN